MEGDRSHIRLLEIAPVVEEATVKESEQGLLLAIVGEEGSEARATGVVPELHPPFDVHRHTKVVVG